MAVKRVGTLKPIPSDAMKHDFSRLLARLAVHVWLVFVSPLPLLAGAPADVTYWTSVEGVTIWASLTGWEGSNVILIKSGREYRVPLSRLTPESAARARRLLAIPANLVLPATQRKVGEPDEPLALPVIDPPLDSPTPGLLLLPPPRTEPAVGGSSSIRLENRLAIAPTGVPAIIQVAINAANRLQDKTYKWGGGRARLEDDGYDCSGSVSYILIHAGLLRSPLTSGSFTGYGAPGPGRWITLYARNGHVFMTLCGLRLDTGGHGACRENGPRWCPNFRATAGYVTRHPPGL